MTQSLIIGLGAAGISAAETIRRLDPNGDITLVSEERDGYYSRPGLAYLLTGEVPETLLYPFSKEDFKRLRLKLVQMRVQQIQPQQHQVVFQDGKQLGYDRLLIATGARAVKSNLPGVDLQGVVMLDSLEETRQIVKLARRAHQAVVVGGGITALELVEGLRARGVQVNYFLRGERYWPNVLDETESRIGEGRLKREGVRIHTHTELSEILGKNGKVTGVRTEDGRQLQCDLVGIAIGVAPRKELAEAAGLSVEKGILVGDTMQTSSPDIYAAGDVAQVFDPSLGRAIIDSLWGPARLQGRTAGINMAAGRENYVKGAAFNVTRLAGLTTTIIGSVGGGARDPDVVGIVRGDSEGWRYQPEGMVVQSTSEVNRLRLLLGETQVIGGVVMGDQAMSRVVQQLVAKQVDIGSIRQRLLQPDISIEAVLSDFIAGQQRTKGS
jgi:NAD(P)H-nitrite reductase large subunit